MSTALVVGSGPNGLTAAAILARAGVAVTVLEAAETVGGGARSIEGILPGLVHDHCSAVHPIAAGSTALRELGLERRGLRWLRPELDCVHPLDDGRAGVLTGGAEQTAAGLGVDGPRWRALFGASSRAWDELSGDALGPVVRVPRHPLRMARFGAPVLLPGAVLARCFATDEARALFGGVAAHAMHPLDRPLTAGAGVGIITAGHRHGWVVAGGGTGAITDALVAVLHEHGGKIETGVRVHSADQLTRADVVLLDTAPGAAARILGDRLPARAARAYRAHRHGPAAFKVDFAVEGGVPWTAEPARRAGTVHLGGDLAEIVAGERDVHAGRMPERPFVLVGQQYLADPARSVGDVHPVWSYAHVPGGWPGDATEAITAQIERFAPGFRERVVGTAVRSVAATAAENENFVGGDILTGMTTPVRTVLGPRPALHPYDTGVPGVYLCSAATPPGPGAHGLCGAHAAARALRHLRR